MGGFGAWPRRWQASCVGLVAASVLLGAAALAVGPARAQRGREPAAGYAHRDLSGWRFRHHERRVKVVLLAGSIGAHWDMPYGRLFHEWCANAEVQNLSQVGRGAPELFRSFRRDVLHHPLTPIGAPGLELWLLWAGGMNSVSAPTRTNRAAQQMFSTAHRHDFQVVALTLTPWGNDEQMSGAQGAHLARSTRRIVDFVLGRLSPAEALGALAERRRGPPDRWRPEERPDVAIDVFDSPLRQRDASARDLEAMRRSLRSDQTWRNRVASLSEADRAERLEEDARLLAEAPRWYLKRRFRGFDSVHPNRAGHRALAAHACPRLPRSWGCRCP